MPVLDRLANALGRNDERPNVELAEALAANPDAAAVRDLVAALTTGPAPVRADAIKVLYELGERRPEALKDHAATFFELLGSRNNRLVWGAMSALAALATTEAGVLAKRLPEILEAADKGSVITRDKAMAILSQLAQAGHQAALPALLDRLDSAAPNQFPMYAEIALPAVEAAHKARFEAILKARLANVPQPAKRVRIEKVLRKLG